MVIIIFDPNARTECKCLKHYTDSFVLQIFVDKSYYVDEFIFARDPNARTEGEYLNQNLLGVSVLKLDGRPNNRKVAYFKFAVGDLLFQELLYPGVSVGISLWKVDCYDILSDAGAALSNFLRKGECKTSGQIAINLVDCSVVSTMLTWGRHSRVTPLERVGTANFTSQKSGWVSSLIDVEPILRLVAPQSQRGRGEVCLQFVPDEAENQTGMNETVRFRSNAGRTSSANEVNLAPRLEVMRGSPFKFVSVGENISCAIQVTNGTAVEDTDFTMETDQTTMNDVMYRIGFSIKAGFSNALSRAIAEIRFSVRDLGSRDECSASQLIFGNQACDALLSDNTLMGTRSSSLSGCVLL